ncbi:MAG: MFS transporter [Porticoccaceae bacterium]
MSGFYFFYFALLGGLYPYWPLYLDSIGFSKQAIGTLLAVPMVTKIIAPNLWSWLGDYTGRRLAIMRLGALLGLLCFIGIFFSTSFFWLACVMVGYSFFWNAVLPQHEVITLSFLGDQPERYSRVRLWGSVGFVVAVIGAGYCLEGWGVELFPYVGLALLLCIFASSLTIPKPSIGTRTREKYALWRAVRQPAVIAFLCAGVLLQVAHGAYYSFFSIYMEEQGYSHTAIGVLWSVGVVAEIIMFTVMHNVLIRFGVRTVLIASLVLAAVRWLMIGYAADSLLLLVFAQCLHAFSFGTFHASAIDTIRRLFNDGAQGGGQALYGAVSFGVGGAAGSYFAGRYWSLGADVIFTVAALACVLAAVIAWYGFRDKRLSVVM